MGGGVDQDQGQNTGNLLSDQETTQTQNLLGDAGSGLGTRAASASVRLQRDDAGRSLGDADVELGGS